MAYGTDQAKKIEAILKITTPKVSLMSKDEKAAWGLLSSWRGEGYYDESGSASYAEQSYQVLTSAVRRIYNLSAGPPPVAPEPVAPIVWTPAPAPIPSKEDARYIHGVDTPPTSYETFGGVKYPVYGESTPGVKPVTISSIYADVPVSIQLQPDAKPGDSIFVPVQYPEYTGPEVIVDTWSERLPEPEAIAEQKTAIEEMTSWAGDSTSSIFVPIDTGVGTVTAKEDTGSIWVSIPNEQEDTGASFLEDFTSVDNEMPRYENVSYPDVIPTDMKEITGIGALTEDNSIKTSEYKESSPYQPSINLSFLTSYPENNPSQQDVLPAMGGISLPKTSAQPSMQAAQTSPNLLIILGAGLVVLFLFMKGKF